MVSKKIRTMLMAVGAVVLSACETAYPDLIYTPDNEESRNDETRGEIPIAPTLNKNTLFYVSASRGSGAFDREYMEEEFVEHYLNSKFYLLGYRRATAMGEMSKSTNFQTLATDKRNTLDCIMSTSLTTLGTTDHRGKVMMPQDLSGALKHMDDETATKEVKPYIWNDEYPNVGYDFFAYYIDDAKVNQVSALIDKTTLDVTFDGTQDLMIGTAPEVTEELIKTNYPGVTEVSTKEKILTYGEGAYTTYGAEHSMQPRIDMKHCLTRFLVACKQTDPFNVIKVRTLKIKTKTQGTMTVAAADKKDLGFEAHGQQAWLDLISEPKELAYDQTVIVNHGMMVPPEEQYEFEMVYDVTYHRDESGTQTETKTFTYPFVIKQDNGPLKAGTLYYVTLSMYGTSKVEVDIKMPEHWIDGGGVDIGTQD